MCENCEIDLENYNRSLKTKNNLLNVDQRQSFQNSNVYSPNESPEIFSGAPRNYVQEEEDSENDEPKTVRLPRVIILNTSRLKSKTNIGIQKSRSGLKRTRDDKLNQTRQTKEWPSTNTSTEMKTKTSRIGHSQACSLQSQVPELTRKPLSSTG